MRRLIFTNTILAFLLISVFILGYYFIQYPNQFDISSYLSDVEWLPFGSIYFGLIIGAIALSFLPVKNYNPKRKVALFLAVLQGVFLLVLLFKMGASYKENKKEFDNLLSEYKAKADADIKAGFIEIEYVGGLELPDGREKMNAEIDSVIRTYGLSYKNSGCTLIAALVKAQEEYERLTKPYLDKRNGLGWEKRMKQQIEDIRYEYR